MTTLPTNAESIARKSNILPPERAAQILDHLKALAPEAQSRTIEQIIQGGGDEGRFLLQVLGKDEPGRKDAPHNKKLSPPETT